MNITIMAIVMRIKFLKVGFCTFSFDSCLILDRDLKTALTYTKNQIFDSYIDVRLYK